MSEALCEVWFYHLERSGLDQVLPELLERTLGRGWKAIVRTREAERVEHMDGWLWAYRDDSFLPHGLASEDHAVRQPILLSESGENLNGAQALFIVDESELGTTEGYERCFIIFDGRNEQALQQARERWRTLKAANANLAYWKQTDEGRWEKAA